MSSELAHEAASRESAFLAALVVIAGQTWLVSILGLHPVWPLAVVSAALLVGSVGAYMSDRQEPPPALKWFARSVVVFLALVNAVCVVLLVRGVFSGSGLRPGMLLLAGAVLWVVNVAVFALVYWEIDGGGPEARLRGDHDFPDLVFPQQQDGQAGLAPADWQPRFSDYLYVSLTASTAFSPTDAMPYSRKAKLLMGMESTISFMAVAMLVARAVNIAGGAPGG